MTKLEQKVAEMIGDGCGHCLWTGCENCNNTGFAPFTIDDSDACMGKAIKLFREMREIATDNAMAGLIQEAMRPDNESPRGDREIWFYLSLMWNHATAEDIFRICVKAKGEIK